MKDFTLAVRFEDAKKAETILNLAGVSWKRVVNVREMTQYDYIMTCTTETRKQIINAMNIFDVFCYVSYTI